MVDYVTMVREFMMKHGQHWELSPSAEIPHEIKVLRLRLMMEELGELASAMHKGDMVQIADGLADLVYVVVGTALAFGIPLDQVFTEVHRSNMTKARLDRTQKGGKVSKEGFEPPKIEEILKKFGWEPLPEDNPNLF